MSVSISKHSLTSLPLHRQSPGRKPPNPLNDPHGCSTVEHSDLPLPLATAPPGAELEHHLLPVVSAEETPQRRDAPSRTDLPSRIKIQDLCG